MQPMNSCISTWKPPTYRVGLLIHLRSMPLPCSLDWTNSDPRWKSGRVSERLLTTALRSYRHAVAKYQKRRLTASGMPSTGLKRWASRSLKGSQMRSRTAMIPKTPYRRRPLSWTQLYKDRQKACLKWQKKRVSKFRKGSNRLSMTVQETLVRHIQTL